MHLGLAPEHLPSGFPTKTMNPFPLSPIRATRSVHLTQAYKSNWDDVYKKDVRIFDPKPACIYVLSRSAVYSLQPAATYCRGQQSTVYSLQLRTVAVSSLQSTACSYVLSRSAVYSLHSVYSCEWTEGANWRRGKDVGGRAHGLIEGGIIMSWSWTDWGKPRKCYNMRQDDSSRRVVWGGKLARQELGGQH